MSAPEDGLRGTETSTSRVSLTDCTVIKTPKDRGEARALPCRRAEQTRLQEGRVCASLSRGFPGFTDAATPSKRDLLFGLAFAVKRESALFPTWFPFTTVIISEAPPLRACSSLFACSKPARCFIQRQRLGAGRGVAFCPPRQVLRLARSVSGSQHPLHSAASSSGWEVSGNPVREGSCRTSSPSVL